MQDVRGSSPAWTLGPTLGKVQTEPVSQLATTGFKGFYAGSHDPLTGTRKHFDSSYAASGAPIAEPALSVGTYNTDYYTRRRTDADPTAYRPHIRQFKPTVSPDKPDRKKFLTGPQDDVGAAHITQGIRAIQVRALK
eukprot:scaffold73257_cov37-Prasinocladus_malaysianus.AAC.1